MPITDHDTESPRRRKRLRLPHYDYASPGGYFVTVCTSRRACLLGRVESGAMAPNPFGKIVETCWRDLPNHYPHVILDAFVVMPNHVHGILFLESSRGRPTSPSGIGRRHGLPEIVRAFKTFSARRINGLRHAPGKAFWQRGYHEHVIRDETSLAEIREYVATNPARWALDRENPGTVGRLPGAGAGLKPAPTGPGGPDRVPPP